MTVTTGNNYHYNGRVWMDIKKEYFTIHVKHTLLLYFFQQAPQYLDSSF